MKSIKKKRLAAVLLALIFIISGFNYPVVLADTTGTETTTSTATNINDTSKATAFTFVLDPGHGQKNGADSGAVSSDGKYIERDLNLKIAMYLKAELEKFDNVKVYMTRTTKVSNFYTMDGIGEYAASVNADALISLHNNSTTNAGIQGAMVLTPNKNYDTYVYENATGLGNAILNQLVVLGLNNRGLLLRNSENGSQYPDGSLRDYYSIVAQGKENHVPAIIVEHAYISNEEDCKNFLTTELQLAALAAADAKGIAEWYGLGDNQGKKVVIHNGVDYSSVFDYDYYINKYADLKKAFANDPSGALLHFIKYGMKEGRQAIESFNLKSYKYKYSDLRRAYGNDNEKYYQHYMKYGKREGRIATGVTKMQNAVTKLDGVDYSAVYNYQYYYDKYEDVRKECGEDDLAVLKHFVNKGMAEGRQASASFDYNSYYLEYRDLRRAFGSNTKSYYEHYMKYGIKENRHGTGNTELKGYITVYNGIDYKDVYDFNFYINRYEDLKKAFGYNDEAALKHFVTCGMKEHRQASASFDVISYRLKYADLRVAFRNDYEKYYQHYMKYGKKEGRTATGVTTLQNPLTKLNGVDYSAVYDFYYYAARYADLRRAYGSTDDVAMLSHFVRYGMNENRQAKETYDKEAYEMLKGVTPIMGTTTVTKDQLVKYYNSTGVKYPEYYSTQYYEDHPNAPKEDAAPTIDALAQIYIEECAAEGVRAEVAFAQAMHETGLLQFGGLVKVSDLNFAGMGATDSAVGRKVATFDSVRLGVRAHVQHLKAYASEAQLVKACVDPRFGYVKRGCAPYIEYLAIPKNPSGYGWASDADYAVKIKSIISAIKSR